MLWRVPEAEVIPLCEREGISQIVWSPLAQGVLTGKYAPGESPPRNSRAASDSMGAFIGQLVQPRVLEAVQGLRAVADAAGLTMVQLALAWVLRQPNVASAIIGATRPAQVRANSGSWFVRRWVDQAGGDDNAQQLTDAWQPQFIVNGPGLTNRPAIRFDGLNDLLSLPAVPGFISTTHPPMYPMVTRLVLDDNPKRFYGSCQDLRDSFRVECGLVGVHRPGGTRDAPCEDDQRCGGG